MELAELPNLEEDQKAEKLEAFFEENMYWVEEFYNDFDFFTSFTNPLFAYADETEIPSHWNIKLGVYIFYHALRNGEYAKAKDCMEKYRLSVEQRSLDDVTRGVLYYALASYAQEEVNPDARRRYLYECYHLWKDVKPQKELLDMQRALCDCCIQQQNYKEAQKYAKLCEETIQSIPENEYTFQIAIRHSAVLLDCVKIEKELGTINNVWQYMEQAEGILQRYKELQHDGIFVMLAVVYTMYERLFSSIGRKELRLEYARKSLECVEEAYRCLNSPKNYRNLSIGHQDYAELISNIDQKVFHFNKAIEIAKDIYVTQNSRRSLEDYVYIIRRAAANMPIERAGFYMDLMQRVIEDAGEFKLSWRAKNGVIRELLLYYKKKNEYDDAFAQLDILKKELEIQKDKLSENDYLSDLCWNYKQEAFLLYGSGHEDMYEMVALFEKANAIEERLFSEKESYLDGVNAFSARRYLVAWYTDMGMKTKALKHLRKQLASDKEVAESYVNATTLENYVDSLRQMAKLYEGNFEYKKALEYYMETYEQNRKLYAQRQSFLYLQKLIDDLHMLCRLLIRYRMDGMVIELCGEMIMRCMEYLQGDKVTEDEAREIRRSGIQHVKWFMAKAAYLQGEDVYLVYQYLRESMEGICWEEDSEQKILQIRLEKKICMLEYPAQILSKEAGMRLLSGNDI